MARRAGFGSYDSAMLAEPTPAPSYTRRFWAKAGKARESGPQKIHLLEHHLADVGVCFEAIIAQPTVRDRLARSAGLETIGETTAARLALLAALHDIGKVNIGFQTKVWRDNDWPGGQRPPAPAGHFNELVPVMNRDDSHTADWFFDNLGWWWDAIETWDDRGGMTVCNLFVATLSHHGQPLNMNGSKPSNHRLWRAYGDLDPAEYVQRIGELARGWFPRAFDADAPPLPGSPELQHHFLGLCTLADWIGSNEDWFPYESDEVDDYITMARRRAGDAIARVGIDISTQRRSFGGVPTDFGQLFGLSGAAPNAIQQFVRESPVEDRLVIIESETGSGKTEAALLRFARLYEEGLVDGMYFALPTRAAATQIHGRVSRFVEQLYPKDVGPDVVLAVPGYIRAGDIEGRHLQNYEVWWEDHADADLRGRRWAAESSKRFLAAQIAVGTVDQAMLATLKVRHAHMRAACLSRNLLVVDEVHASDVYMRRVLRDLLDAHIGAGGYALLMSATLGSAARGEWLAVGSKRALESQPLQEAIAAPYPSISTSGSGGKTPRGTGENGQDKSVSIKAEPHIKDHSAVALMALKEARTGAKVLVIRNTVSAAVETQQALEGAMAAGDDPLLFSLAGNPTLHHGRFAVQDRRELDRAVEEQLGKDRSVGGLVIVGTQTLEQSLDIDADLLITDLCPVDVLLQRIGRLHRHSRQDRAEQFREPRCITLTPEDGDLAAFLKKDGGNMTGLGPGGYVYPDIRTLEATRSLIEEHPTWHIPNMNRMLVERATHRDALREIVERNGIEWAQHEREVTGGYIADDLTARDALIRRNKAFFEDNEDVLFGANEEAIRTRLGDEGVEVGFEPAPQSPFDSQRHIESLTIGAHLLRGAMPSGPVGTEKVEGGFTFSIGEQSYLYDRLGLRRET